MALTAEERVKIRYYLGYPNVDLNPSLGLGFPSVNQTGFILESSMNNLRADAEFLVRRALVELECIEDQLSKSRNNYATRKVEKVEFDPDEEFRLSDQYLHWAKALADTLGGVPINPFSQRHQMMAGEVIVIEPV